MAAEGLKAWVTQTGGTAKNDVSGGRVISARGYKPNWGLRMRYGDGAKRYIPCLLRFAMQCPRCNHHHTQKIGLSRHKRQRWKCMGCRRTFGDKDLRLIDPKIKALALAMYAEGIAARKIERLLHVSHNAVLGWVRKEVAGKALQAPTAKDLAVIEADEMWSYVGSKNSPSGCGGQ